jgi:hypothetical protein
MHGKINFLGLKQQPFDYAQGTATLMLLDLMEHPILDTIFLHFISKNHSN